MDDSERTLEDITADDVRFRRDWFYFWASVLAWVLFWEHADRHQASPHAQLLSWTIVLVAMWVASTF